MAYYWSENYWTGNYWSGNYWSGEVTAGSPSVTTGAATEVTKTGATIAFEVTNDGNGTLSAAGVCYGLSQNPTTSDDKVDVETPAVDEFSVDLTGLSAYTHYHYRAYVTNEISTAYGEDYTFYTGDTATVQRGIGIQIGIGIEDNQHGYSPAEAFETLVLGAPLGLPLA